MESRKYQLQKQILEALKANDNELYSLLRSHWAHRFGVESLEELKNLDLNQEPQKTTNEDNQEIDQSKDDFSEVDQEISIKDDDNQEKGIMNETKKVFTSVEFENKASFEIKSNEMVDKKNNEKKDVNPVREYKSPPKVEALIPLPPKPKYSYLKKWIFKK